MAGPVLPHFRCSSRPGGSGQGLEVPRLCRFIRRPDHELAAGEEPAPNFLHFQPDHGSRAVPAAPKVRENPAPGGARLRAKEDPPPEAEPVESPYDTEARYRTRSGTAWIGYLVHTIRTQSTIRLCEPLAPRWGLCSGMTCRISRLPS